MNEKRYCKNIACLYIAAAVMANAVQAQEAENSPAAFERMKMENLWHRSSNAGGILLDNPLQYSAFDVSYHNTEGNFRRPQQGQKENGINFSAEGGVNIEKLYVWGNFEYQNENADEVNFNSSIIDPYRGMPYYTADLNASKWNRQFYDMQFRAAIPLFKWLSAGVGGIYRVAQAAKQRDPRTLNHLYSLDLNPGIVFSPAKAHRIGLNFEYSNFKENSSPSLVNVSDYQIYYELYGLGTAIENIGTGKMVNYVGNKMGGNMQYNLQNDAVNILLSGGYTYGVEKAEFSFTTPEKFGTTHQKEWNAKAMLNLSGDKFSHYLQASYANDNIDGIQYVKRNTANQGWQALYSNIRSIYQTQTAAADYTLAANRGREYVWKVGVGTHYQKKNDKYLLPNSFKNAENLIVSVNGKAMVYRSDKFLRRVLLGAAAGYSQNLSGDYSYTGNHADYRIVTELEQNDLNYLISDYCFFGGNVTYSQKIRQQDRANLYIKAAMNYCQTSSFDFDRRSFFQISIGCNY